MNKARAEQLIVVSLFVLLASTVGSKLAGEEKPGQEKHFGRKIVGGFFTMLFASVAAEFAPEVGALLAISVASYAFFTEGLPAINKTAGKSNKEVAKEKQPNLHNPKERLPFTPGPEISPLPLMETSPISLGGELIV